MHKFPKIRYPNDSATNGISGGEVVVTEKIDGANFRCTRDSETGKLDIGTRNVVYEDALNNENVPKAFRHAVKYIERQTDGWDEMLGEYNHTELVLYGEAMHLHSLDYDDIDWNQPPSGAAHVPLASDTPNVVFFDARVKSFDEWLHWDSFVDCIENSPFEQTRILERGEPDELSFAVPDESMFGGKPEGIVARRVDGTVRAKKVTDDFREKNAVSFESPLKAQTDAGQFVAAFVTEARIEKTAHKLVDEGTWDEVQMEMMEDLPRDVLQDVMDEEGWNLLTSGGFEGVWDDDFKSKVRSKTSKKCARVLKQMLQSF